VTDKGSDIALGYFSNLEFTADLELSFPFVREMYHYVRFAVDQMKNNEQHGVDETKNKPGHLTSIPYNQMTDPIGFDSAPALPSNVRISYA
jgi:hypothetical protein